MVQEAAAGVEGGSHSNGGTTLPLPAGAVLAEAVGGGTLLHPASSFTPHSSPGSSPTNISSSSSNRDVGEAMVGGVGQPSLSQRMSQFRAGGGAASNTLALSRDDFVPSPSPPFKGEGATSADITAAGVAGGACSPPHPDSSLLHVGAPRQSWQTRERKPGQSHFTAIRWAGQQPAAQPQTPLQPQPQPSPSAASTAWLKRLVAPWRSHSSAGVNTAVAGASSADSTSAAQPLTSSASAAAIPSLAAQTAASASSLGSSPAPPRALTLEQQQQQQQQQQRTAGGGMGGVPTSVSTLTPLEAQRLRLLSQGERAPLVAVRPTRAGAYSAGLSHLHPPPARGAGPFIGPGGAQAAIGGGTSSSAVSVVTEEPTSMASGVSSSSGTGGVGGRAGGGGSSEGIAGEGSRGAWGGGVEPGAPTPSPLPHPATNGGVGSGSTGAQSAVALLGELAHGLRTTAAAVSAAADDFAAGNGGGRQGDSGVRTSPDRQGGGGICQSMFGMLCRKSTV